MKGKKMDESEKFELIQTLLRRANELKLEMNAEPPANELAFVYVTGHSAGIDDVMNLLRREL
jgi:hypothetical protein